MTAKLFCKYGRLKGGDFEIEDEATIGRTTENTVILMEKSISGKHARLFRDKKSGCYMLEDLGSTNGTHLDGIPIKEPEKLGRLHMINFGGSADFFFQDLDLCAGKAPVAEDKTAAKAKRSAARPKAEPKPKKAEPKAVKDTEDKKEAIREHTLITHPFKDKEPVRTPSIFNKPMAQEPPPDEADAPTGEVDGPRVTTLSEAAPVHIPEALASRVRGNLELARSSKQQRFQLVVKNLMDKQVVLDLHEGENIIGRSDTLRLQINSSEVSRHHAVITVSDGTVWLRDTGSTNHTYHEWKMVEKETAVKAGSLICFGKIECRLEVVD